MNKRSPYILPGWTKTQPRSRDLGPDDIQGYPTHAQRPRRARRLALVARNPTRPETYACPGELQGLRRKGESVSSLATCSCDRGVVIPGAIAPDGWICWFPTAVRFASPRVIRARERDVSLGGFAGGIWAAAPVLVAFITLRAQDLPLSEAVFSWTSPRLPFRGVNSMVPLVFYSL